MTQTFPLNEILYAMRSRMPWPVARTLLNDCKIPVSHGWDKTLQKAKKHKTTDAEIAKLTASFKEHILCGEKNVRYYAVNNAQLSKIRNYFSQLKIPNSDFKNSYPLPISGKKLDSNLDTPLTLTAVEDVGDSLAVIYSSVKIYEERTDVPLHLVKTESLDHRFSKVIGIAHHKFQAYDVILIPKKGNAFCVRTDIIGSLGPAVQQAAQESLRTRLQDDTGITFLEPQNLFPVMEKMYNSHSEGTVVELAFATNTASLKHEKMRHKNSCLRKEIYHKGGKAALKGKIIPYKIGIRWTSKKGNLSPPELAIYGTSAMTLEVNPAVYDAQFVSCMGTKDFKAIDDRVQHYLAGI